MDYDNYYSNIDRVFSKAASIYDSKIYANYLNVYIREMELEVLFKYYDGKNNAMEVGFGTGEETRKVISVLDTSITGIDISEGMVKYASDKIKSFGLTDKFRCYKKKASEISSIDGTFDCIYSFNGALNNEPLLKEFIDGLKMKLSPGGYFIVSLRNKYSLGELIIDIFSGNPMKIAERIKGNVLVEVVGEKIPSRYFSTWEFEKIIGKDMRLVEKEGLSIIFLPLIYDKINGPKMKKIVVSVEKMLSRIPFIKNLGDEVIFVFRRR